MWGRITFVVCLIVHCSFYLFGAERRHIESASVQNACRITQECRAGICMYECIENDMSFNRFVVQGITLYEAYAAWLEITGGAEYLLFEIPKENYSYPYNDLNTIEYRWENPYHLTILIHEKQKVVGMFIIKQANNQVVIDDFIFFIR